MKGSLSIPFKNLQLGDTGIDVEIDSTTSSGSAALRDCPLIFGPSHRSLSALLEIRVRPLLFVALIIIPSAVQTFDVKYLYPGVD